jgi:hypothetical protein
MSALPIWFTPRWRQFATIDGFQFLGASKHYTESVNKSTALRSGELRRQVQRKKKRSIETALFVFIILVPKARLELARGNPH